MSSCDRCGKECKDKRGLTLHIKKCDGNKPSQCEFCKEDFSNQYILAVHLTRCKIIKAQNKEKEVIAREETIKKLSSKEEENKQLNERLKEMDLKYQKDLNDMKKSLRLDYEQQLKLRDTDLSSIMKDYNDMGKNLKVMDMTAFTLCMENKLPIIVFDMNEPGNLLKVVEGMQVGTLVG